MSEIKMVHLLSSFPSMPCKKVREWNCDFLTEPGGLIDIYRPSSSGQKRAIEFCLNVWNQDTDWTEFGYQNFNFASAFGTWDDAHKAAFLAWAKDPFFP